MMKPTPLLATTGLAIGGIAAAVLLVPQTPEQMAMLVRDGRYESAGRIGDTIDTQARGDPMLLADLFELNTHIGDSHRAREMIEAYLASRPDDMAMLKEAAEFFRSMQDFGAYLDIKERIVEKLRDPSDIERLAALYRSHARFEDERRILYTYRDRALSPAAMGRLGSLLAREGDYAEATRLLEAAVAGGRDEDGNEDEDEGGGRGDGETGSYRLLLFDSLIADGKADHAAELAGAWVEQGLAGPAAQAVMVMTLANGDHGELAAGLAATFPLSAARDPSALVWALGEHRRFDLVKQALAGWLDGADDALLARGASLYIETVASTGALGEMTADLSAALQRGDASARPAMAVAAAVYGRWSYEAIAPLRHLMTGELLATQPLFAADLSLHEGNLVAVRYFLLHADLSDYDDRHAAMWSELAQETLSPSEIAQDLIARWRAGRLSPALYPLLQKTAAASGSTSLAFDLFRDGPDATGAGL